MERFDEGYSFFSDWAEELVSLGEFDSRVENKHYISWQV